MTWSSHRRPIVPALTTILMVSLVLFRSAAAFACSCMSSASPCTLFSTTDAIFVGTPVSVEPHGSRSGISEVRFHFQVERTIKGVAAETVDVDTFADSAACGYPFERGVKYLVYASRGADAFGVSLCSRTGPLAARNDDIALLTEAAAGRAIQPRLFGNVYRVQLNLDGFFMHYGNEAGLVDVPIRVRDGGQVREQRTDRGGRFTIVGLTPGRHVVETELPAPYEPLFNEKVSANVDQCFGEVSVAVAAASLRGTVSPSEATPGRPIQLRLAQLGPDGGVRFERSTVAFAEPDGSWKVAGLPPGRYLLGVSAFEPPTPDTPYPTTWYPGALKPEQATVLTVSDERPIAVDFRLPARLPAGTVSGTTVGIDGSPVSGASVTLRDMEEPGPTSDAVGYATSDERGHFTIATLRNRHYRIQGMVVRPGGGTQSDWIDLPDEKAQQDVTIVLKPGR